MEQYRNDEEIRRYLRERKRREAAKRRRIAGLTAVMFAMSLAIVIGLFIGAKVYDRSLRSTPTIVSDVPMVQTAAAQLGNKGGEPYWSWFGFDSRVEWCACFASWCANECGYIKSGQAPKFAMVDDGARWFIDKGMWIDEGGTPAAGDMVFFDWDQDHAIDHVGIVSGVTRNLVFTIEGNSSDLCRQKCYTLDSPVIYGYGHIVS